MSKIHIYKPCRHWLVVHDSCSIVGKGFEALTFMRPRLSWEDAIITADQHIKAHQEEQTHEHEDTLRPGRRDQAPAWIMAEDDGAEHGL